MKPVPWYVFVAIFLLGAFLGKCSAVEFDTLKILPRQDDPAFAQTIKGWRLDVSNDGEVWTVVVADSFDNSLTEKTVALPRQSARFVRFAGLSGNSGDLAAIAEINLSLGGESLSRVGWIATADSAPDYPAALAIDGNANTCWHTAWAGGVTPYPHALTLDTLGPIIGDTVVLQWDANAEPPALAGYSIAYGTNPAALDRALVLGKVTEATLSGLAPGTWYFAAQARCATGIVSAFCPQISVVLVAAPVDLPPSLPPLPPRRLRALPPAISTAIKPAAKWDSSSVGFLLLNSGPFAGRRPYGSSALGEKFKRLAAKEAKTGLTLFLQGEWSDLFWEWRNVLEGNIEASH